LSQSQTIYTLILELINRLIYIKQSVNLENELLAMLQILLKDLENKQAFT